MNWLKCKIKKWLREEVFKEELKTLELMNSRCTYAVHQSDHALNEVEEMKLLYQSITNVSVDVDYHGKNSWAVICIDGHPEYVKFVDLSGSEARDIENFLKRFERSNVVVDSPFRNDYIKGYELW